MDGFLGKFGIYDFMGIWGPGAITVYGQKGSGTVNKRLTNCEQIFEKSRMASNENS